MLLQLFKAWRIVLPENSSVNAIHSFWLALLNLLFVLIVFVHAAVCSFLLVGNFELQQGGRSWVTNKAVYDLDMSNCVIRYTEGFYFAVIGLSAVGYSDLLVTSPEHALNGFVLLISQLFAAKVCADLTWLTSMYNQHEAEAHEKRRSLMMALDKMGVPKVLVKRVLAFQSYENTMHADSMEKDTFRGLGANLMDEL